MIARSKIFLKSKKIPPESKLEKLLKSYQLECGFSPFILKALTKNLALAEKLPQVIARSKILLKSKKIPPESKLKKLLESYQLECGFSPFILKASTKNLALAEKLPQAIARSKIFLKSKRFLQNRNSKSFAPVRNDF
ncbi:MAG: hypothetical protein PHQ74_05585 [Crocinitomicaceae bacterium]|nr:hypothetical protein [Crocinitomicaceae bacterium]